MFNLLKSDMYRLVHGKMLWVATAVLAGCIVLCAAMMHWVSDPQFLCDAAKMSATVTVTEADELDVAADEAAREMAEATAEERERAMGAASGVGEEGGVADGGSAGFEALLEFEDPSKLSAADFEETSREMRTIDAPTFMFGDMLVSGGFLGALVAVVVALLIASDFSTKFVRNLPMDRRGRVAYYGGRLVLVAVVALYFLAVGCVLSLVAFLAAGFTFAALDGAAELLVFLGLSWLCLVAYGCMTAVLVWLTRSAGAGVAFALVVATGIAGTMAGSLLQNFGMAVPALAAVQPWLLSTCMNHDLALPAASLLLPAEGAAWAIPVGAQVAIVGAFWVAACTALALAVLRRRDV
ncbi:hypothetical protein VJ918_10195 [Adlercreutzia sp. R21]|uniref:hypothetical protein n=1 Tax=Adlercreutzia wanghongyangiae TaxID=3111451 RepID=UPI002DBFEBF2|nr:hypothetical protein [Adlercreutzia sp. R21]MEC4185179.1 hypothetical protein [Adlercreutzia sp. R21]